MTYKFTNRAQKAIEISNSIALELGHSYIGYFIWLNKRRCRCSCKSSRKPRCN